MPKLIYNMAPHRRSLWRRLDFETEVNIWSMAGTWIGAVVALFGLISVFIQLQRYLSTRRKRQKKLVQRIAGQYAPLVEPSFRNKDLVESVAPYFHAWMQGAYLGQHSLTLVQGDRGMSGTSSWSKLLTQIGIQVGYPSS